MHPSTIYLYGPPGSGKTTLGKLLAGSLALPFIDLDVEIENHWGCTIPQIFSSHGEAAFRQSENQEIEKLQSRGKAIVALGGGSLLNSDVRELVQNHGLVLCLHADPGVLLDRLSEEPSQREQYRERPLLGGDVASRLEYLLSQRADHYASFPLKLDTTHLDPYQAAWQVQILFGRFRVGNISQPYPVSVQPGGLRSVGELIAQQDLHGPVGLVTDTNVGPLYAASVAKSLDDVGIPWSKLIIPAGESFKTIDTVQTLWEDFLDASLERGSMVLALGGGVVGDLAGFASSTYMRGIRWMNVPTTLLAMVDASLGGKTGVDIRRGKNLVGTFHTPSLVLADPEVLQTLPEVEFRSGLAEVIKHGIIADPGLFEECEGITPENRGDLKELVARSMAVKIRIIESDPYERGARETLNLGHTIGHALELASGFHLRHGEAVAIGIVVEAHLAEILGLAENGLSQQIASVLARGGLPVAIPGNLDRDAIRHAITVDKKKALGRVRFALPVRIGQVQMGVDVPDDVLASEI
jgi:shikimate kinase/3-dehydroquinate synthase